MRIISLAILSFIIVNTPNAQTPNIQAASDAQENFGRIDGYKYFVKKIDNASEEYFTSVLLQYDEFIAAHPDNVIAAIERCNFIEYAFYDEYEGYSLKGEEASECRKVLLERYPEHPAVLIYHSMNVYGDTAEIYLESLIQQFKSDPSKWNDSPVWLVYSRLVDLSNDDKEKALQYARTVETLNDTLDLSLKIAQLLVDLKRNEEAVAKLLLVKERIHTPYENNDLGKMALELNEVELALEFFELAEKDTSGWLDNENMAATLNKLGEHDRARIYLLKEYNTNTYNKLQATQALFRHDLRYGPRDSVLLSYNRLKEIEWTADPFLVNHLKMAVKWGAVNFQLSDVLRILLVALVILCLFILPYLWVLPIQAIGLYRQNKGWQFSGFSFNWGLRHFWLISFLYLLVSMTALLLFNHDGIVNYFVNDTYVDQMETSSIADMLVFFMLSMLVVATVLMGKSHWRSLIGNTENLVKNIFKAIGWVLLIRLTFNLIVKAFDIDLNSSEWNSTHLVTNEDIMALGKSYGIWVTLLFICLLVPFYEEIIFRGIVLSASEKRIGFIGATIFQALLFTVVHENIKVFPFIFLIGIIAARLRNLSTGLLVPIVFHGFNNLLATVSILKQFHE